MRRPRSILPLLSAAFLCCLPPAAMAANSFCRAKTSLPPGTYQQSCKCTVEHCDYLICTCDGQYHSTFKITSCTSQSFSDHGGVLTCN